MKIFLALVVLLCPYFVFAQQKKTHAVTPKVHIEGNLGTAAAEKTIRLNYFDEADILVKVDAKGHFLIGLPMVQPGFYNLESVGELYLSPGDQLSLKLNADSTYAFSGKGSRANTIYSGLKRSLSRFLPYREKVGLLSAAYKMDITSFTQKVADFEKYSETVVSEVKDPFFSMIAMKNLQLYDNELLFTFSKGEGRNAKRLDSAANKTVLKRVFYDFDANDLKLFKNASGYRTMVELKIKYLMYTNIDSREIRNKEARILFQRKVAEEMIREPYILNHFKSLFTMDLIKILPGARRDSVYTTFMAGKFTKAQLAGVEQTYRKQVDYGDKGVSPDFDYTDVHGKQIKLSNQRGKYVYIDIWATWCGPCKAQMPALAELENDYHGKNIQFVSISVDELRDKKKWAAYVKENKLGGIQVMADNAFKSDFIQKFNITGIPRFILIGPDGKIIAANAKRPSDPELRNDLNTLIK